MTLSYRIRALERSRRQRPSIDRRPVTDLLAPCYMDLHNDVVTGQHSTYNLPGGRGSCKSSFVSLEMVEGIMNDPDANGIVFRRTGATMRESVYEQIQWAIDELGVGNAWKGNVNPMRFTYLPTGQQIVFRGMDDSSKLKSIKQRKGYFKYIWFEEFAEFQGPNTIRSVLQSVQRGGSDYRIFNTFNPPLSMNSWANKYILIPKKNAITFRTDYRMIPPEWLGEAFIEEAERLKEVNENAYRHEYLGEAIGTGGAVFPNVIQRAIADEDVTNADYIYHGNRIEYVERMKRELYGTFLCYLHLVWHDPYAYDKLLNREIIPYNSKKDAEYRIAIDGSPTDTCWNYLRHTARNFNVDYASIFTAIKFVKAKNDGVKIVEYRTAYTLAEALLYQLFMHISAGEEALNGCTYADCELCHKMFIKDHGNKRFCKECSKNHVRVAAYRKKKKESAPHAQESNP